jgi:hypothetical protein
VYDYSCKAANGAATSELVEALVFDSMRDGQVARVDGVVLSYWNPMELATQTLEDLMGSSHGSGACGTFAQFLMASFGVHAIPSSFVNIEPDATINPNANGFLVKNWGFALQGITAGDNGVNETPRSGDDVEAFPLGNGLPSQVCVTGGGNAVLESSPVPDDLVMTGRPYITTGDDGKADTSAIEPADDQLIAVGEGMPDVTCIAPGIDSIVQSTPGGDDEPLSVGHIAGHYPFVRYHTAVDLLGAPAQNNANPIAAFENHFVVRMQDGHCYDPSYMLGPVTEEQHEGLSKSGIWSGSLCRPGSSARELVYTILFTLQ